MRDQAQQFADADCAVYGISFDSPEDNGAFRTNNEFPFSLLSDETKEVGAAYEAIRDADDPFANFPKRVSYLIDAHGTIQKSYDVSDPAGHAGEVLADLAALRR